jgi:hypothetical protein
MSVVTVPTAPPAPGAAPPLARWLIVVRRDQPGLYASLRARFDDIRLVDVILDRRERERRGAARSVRADRRRGQRRRPPTPAERDHWYTFGYRMVAAPAVSAEIL